MIEGLGPLVKNSNRKANLPRKTCPVCGRSFVWRKKWEKNWESVRYCSKRCAGERERPA